jgi:hypothetical protein
VLQLTLYTHAELAVLLQPTLSQPPHCYQRAAFIPVLIGIILTSSTVLNEPSHIAVGNMAVKRRLPHSEASSREKKNFRLLHRHTSWYSAKI